MAPADAAGQDRIPDMLARAGRSIIAASAPAPSRYVGPDRSIDVLLRVTDVIVRGRLGAPRSLLSDDQREVHTEYPIADPEYLYVATLSNPDLAPATSVTLMGGSIAIKGLTYTATYDALPLPQPGTDCLLLLRRFGGRYHIAGLFYGAFRINDGRLKPLAKDQKFVAEYDGAPASEAIPAIVWRRLSIGQE